MAPLTERRVAGQASLEMTLALIGALLLLFGSFKVFLWLTVRTARSQQYYDCSRVEAGRAAADVLVWNDPSAQIGLRIFGKQPVGANPCP